MPFPRVIHSLALTSMPRLSVWGTAGLGASVLLAGCGAGSLLQSSANGPVTQSVALQGRAFGGQQPVGGATIQLYAVGKSGMGSASTALLTLPVETLANGSFSITGDFICPITDPSVQVYLVATGGDPSPSLANPQLALMAGLGSCNSLSNSTYISMNELTTVATAAALQGYMTDSTHVGAADANDSGLIAAFGRIALLASTSTGAVAPTTLASGSYYSQPLNLTSLANSVAACINSTGGAAGSATACGNLFTYATPSGGTAPGNTIDAILDILNNPKQNVALIYNLAGTTAPFEPALKSAPSDWDLGLYVPVPTLTFSFLNGGTLTMTADPKATQVRYTTDGSTPTVNSTLYTAPLNPLTADTPYSAIDVDARGVVSNVVTYTTGKGGGKGPINLSEPGEGTDPR